MNDKLKNLCRYIFPAMGGLFVTYLYNVVDGVFVGRGVGSRVRPPLMSIIWPQNTIPAAVSNTDTSSVSATEVIKA